MENAYGKRVKMQAKSVPHLVRNSLHFRSVFLSEMAVSNVQYFEDLPRNTRLTAQWFEDHHQHRF